MRETDELISIIVPVYKVEDYLNRCVESIVQQTYRSLEIILVDDGSPDGCPGLCDAWARRDSRISVIHKKNGGLSDARNAGLSKANGAYIGFVDSDDWVFPDMYEKLLRALKSDGSDVAACAVKLVYEDGKEEKFLAAPERAVLGRAEAQRELLHDRRLRNPVWNKLYKRSLVEGLPFEKGRIHEDVFWSYKAIGRASRVSIIPDVGYFYWQRRSSIMGNAYSAKRLDELEALERRQSYLETEFPELADEGLANLWMNFIFHGQSILRYLPGEKKLFYELEKRLRAYPLDRRHFKVCSRRQKVWLCIAKIFFKLVCRIRNVLNKGY